MEVRLVVYNEATEMSCKQSCFFRLKTKALADVIIYHLTPPPYSCNLRLDYSCKEVLSIKDHVVYKISDAEWLVMKVIWQESPLTASSVIERLQPQTDWSPKTIQTLISRLVKKRALGANKDAGLNEYYPLVSKEECMHEETKSFLQKVYDGSLHGLIANFVNSESLSPQEIQELKRLLNEKMK